MGKLLFLLYVLLLHIMVILSLAQMTSDKAQVIQTHLILTIVIVGMSIILGYIIAYTIELCLSKTNQ